MEKLPHETKAMFEKRKKVYENALGAGHDSKSAIKFANMWANINYLGCRYPASLAGICKTLGQNLEI